MAKQNKTERRAAARPDDTKAPTTGSSERPALVPSNDTRALADVILEVERLGEIVAGIRDAITINRCQEPIGRVGCGRFTRHAGPCVEFGKPGGGLEAVVVGGRQ